MTLCFRLLKAINSLMSFASTSIPKEATEIVVLRNSRIQTKMSTKKSKRSEVMLKTPKGTKDWAGKDVILREVIFEALSDMFKRHGGTTIDTPVFELRDILTGKYGEDSKLIYNLEDQGGELTSLRYDLTVPFARFVASNKITSMKRYQIAKVYRRDQPAMTKGRMREFYQCDFDIAGVYDTMVPDSEILSILCEGLKKLGIRDFKIKLNHRKILDGIFQACGVPQDDTRKVSSVVDKLDKLPWEQVKNEMIVEKGQSEEVADKIGEFVKLNGSIRQVIEMLKENRLLKENVSAQQGIFEMIILADYIDAFDISSYISFDLSLARGLDYYTGIIYEAVTPVLAPPPNASKLKERAQNIDDDDASNYTGLGSIAAGGRYDQLVGMFSNGKMIPCVGVSFGVERIFSIIKARASKMQDEISLSFTQVYVMGFGGGESWNGLLMERMMIIDTLWKAGIHAEYMYKAKANSRKQFEAAEKVGAQVAVILGKDEYAEGKLRIKSLGLGDDSSDGDLVQISDLVVAVEKKLAEINKNDVSDVIRLVRSL